MASISQFRNKKTRRAKQHQAQLATMTLDQRMTLFWNEHADVHLLPWLDKRDQLQLQMLNKNWFGIVNSRYLFTTILTSIREVVAENSSKDSLITPDQKKKKMQFTTSRQLPP